jgi:hypothetical protein
VIAFVEDPTGYKFELIQRQGDIPEPLAQVGPGRVWWGVVGILYVVVCLRGGRKLGGGGHGCFLGRAGSKDSSSKRRG